jgi:hypothetical protein
MYLICFSSQIFTSVTYEDYESQRTLNDRVMVLALQQFLFGANVTIVDVVKSGSDSIIITYTVYEDNVFAAGTSILVE